MSDYAAEMINAVPDIENMSYLELGLYAGKTFKEVKAKEKFSVDINPDLPIKPTHLMTTDVFFAQNKRRFDVIFVDADHKVEQVVKDVANAMAVCDKMLFIHDLYPDNTEQACEDGNWAGDGYKMLAYWLVHCPVQNFRILHFDSGLTVVKPPFNKVLLKAAVLCSYEEFLKIANELLVRLDPQQFMEWIKQ